MCGIVGTLRSHPRNRADLTLAVRALRHRGPDAYGIWHDDEVPIALGQSRLAVIDLSEAGAQPMTSRDGRMVVTYNGEVYNYRALRSKLESQGCRFRGGSDTEVLVEGFARWGVEQTLRRADGMFAFGLWDRSTRKLTLGRDRLGEKPLYYGTTKAGFVFASELDALRAIPGFDNEIDRNALALFFRHKYIPAPHSIYQGVHKLLPGCTVTVDHAGTVTGPDPYWSLLDHAVPREIGFEEAVSSFSELLTATVSDRMIADVPLGSFLSGGIDSSLVTAAMTSTGGRVKTFTIGFEESEYDESQDAAAVAHHLGTDHTELTVSPSMALDVVPELPRIYDEPFADSSQIPTHLVAKLARQHVTVALSGDGGDELFGGYNRHLWIPRMLARTGRVPAPLRRAVSAAITATPQHVLDRAASVLLPSRVRPNMAGLKAHKAASALGASTDAHMLVELTSHWSDPAALVINANEPPTLITTPGAWPQLPTVEERLMAVDALTYLPDDILAKVDRAAMAVSLETRAPLLATPIVEFAVGLPASVRLHNGESKSILRAALDQWVPRKLVERPKAGFGVPLAAWLRGPLRPWAEELLAAQRLASEGYLRPDLVRTEWDTLQAGTNGGEFKLWDVLMFQAWLERRSSSL